jgi:adenylosuccinate lyase
MADRLQPINLPEPEDFTYSAIDPLDSRYFDKEIAKYASETARIHYQAYVEAALAHALVDHGICDPKVAQEIEAAARNISVADVYEHEKTTKHDIKALVNTIKSNISDEAKPYVHFGATSYDIIATANALQMRDIVRLVLKPRLLMLMEVLINISEKYKDTNQVGRTHGQHAVPITFGFAISEYVSRLGNSLEAIDDLSGRLSGKFSGAVGSYNALSIFIEDPLDFERKVLEKIGLQPAPYSTQVIPPEEMIRLIDEMVVAAGIMANLAHDMRHLQRSEISEVHEKFEKGQTGSSTMAHKRNPWNFENVVSMWKQVLAQSVNANLNIASEHQRDLTDSASSRFYVLVPVILSGMASRLSRIMGKLEVDEQAMQRNLEQSAGAIAAEPLYLLFEKHGHIAAHEKSKELAHQSLEKGSTLAEAVIKDTEASKYWQKFSEKEKNIITKPEKNYTGLASKKVEIVTGEWRQKLKRIK